MRKSRAFVIAARRSPLGRVGGLHRARRIEALAAPVMVAALDDAGLAPREVDEIILGNMTAGGNPARLVALAAGCSDASSAITLDRRCASGLDAILSAIRIIDAGDADIIVAGGAEALSTAPWQIAKPLTLYQTPRFISPADTLSAAEPAELPGLAPQERLARLHGISREQQDSIALRSHLRAVRARDDKWFRQELVALRRNVEESRDQSVMEADIDDIAAQVPFEPDAGTLTPANTSAPHDGCAFVVAVSETVYLRLGRPPAMQLVTSAAVGVAPETEAEAAIHAIRKLQDRLNGFNQSKIGLYEMAETSAAQLIATAKHIGIDPDDVNLEGGEIARGRPGAAAGAVLATRLFTQMVRRGSDRKSSYGLAFLGATGGLGLAALFEAV